MDSWLGAGWAGPANVLAGCTTLAGGHSQGPWHSNNLALHVGDDAEVVSRNRQMLSEVVAADAMQWLTQVHGSRVVRASPESVARAPQADAVWTDEPGLALAIMTADCVPVLLCSEDGTVVGAAHGGWQGLVEGVLGALVDAMPVAAQSLVAWVGPAICGSCYEVGEDVWQQFVELHGAALSPHREDPHKRFLDLAAVARDQLAARGVGEVSMSGWCTYCDDRFYSHRKACHQGHGVTGRIASVIKIR